MRLLILACLVLTGCGVKTVYIPVSSCAEPPTLVMPSLKVNELSSVATTPEILKAFMFDYVVLKSSLEQCITVVNGYAQSKKSKIDLSGDK